MSRILFIMLAFSFVSCKNNLTKEALTWIPYRVGDTVVFENNFQKTDTLVIVDTYRHYVDNNEIIEVRYTYTSGNTQKPPLKTFILGLTALDNDETALTFNFITSEAFYPATPALLLHQIDTTTFQTKSINNITYTDVITLTSSTSNSTKVEMNPIEMMYWSKSTGLVQFEYAGNVYQLKNIIR